MMASLMDYITTAAAARRRVFAFQEARAFHAVPLSSLLSSHFIDILFLMTPNL